MRQNEARADPRKWLIGRLKVQSDNEPIHYAALLCLILCLENELQTVRRNKLRDTAILRFRESGSSDTGLHQSFVHLKLH